jgi:hypothetical protein
MWHAWEGKEKFTVFWWESSEDRGVDGMMESETIFGRLAGGVEWIQLSQNRDQWRDIVNTAMNLRVLAPRS